MSHSAVSLVFVLILQSMESVGSPACTVSSYFPMGLDIGLAEFPAHLVH